MRVFAISDIHVDYRENLQCIDALSTTSFLEDVLILAGDATHDVALLRATFEILLRKFRHVCFVPGNHELWLHRDYEDSLQKFYGILKLCDSLGIHPAPQYFGVGVEHVCIVPLFSWYTRPEEGDDTLFQPKALEDPTLSIWTDNYRVKWPQLDGVTPSELFRRMNFDRVSRTYEASVISFSHFLPKRELIYRTPEEETRLLSSADNQQLNFTRVAGSTLIEAQIRQLRSLIHVYGHQHRNRCRHYDGVWYISNCFGYGHERENGSVVNPPGILKIIWPLEKSGLRTGMVKQKELVRMA